MRRVFVINGLPGVGKSLFGELVKSELQSLGIDFLHTSSIDLVKHLLLPVEKWDDGVVPRKLWGTMFRLKRTVTLHDWDGETKDVYWRGVMSNLKAAINNYDSDLINEWVLGRAETVSDDGVVFVDIREEVNIEGFKQFCVQKEAAVRIETVCIISDRNEAYDNRSDDQVMTFPHDIYVTNDRVRFGEDREAMLAEFKKRVGDFVEAEIIGRRIGPEVV